MSYDHLDWKFIQSFGDDNASDDELVTALSFNETGDYLAVGDKAGRICLFEVDYSKKSHRDRKGAVEYKFYTEFQSHECEFDCLKSLEIEEKINMVQWLESSSKGMLLLATNDKTIKFWRVHDKKIQRPMGNTNSVRSRLNVPKLAHYQTVTTDTPKRVFSNAHAYHINSISVNSDKETFLSADDLRINLWDLETSKECFNIVDIKPTALEELTEVITSATFHPTECNTLMYSTSRGSIRMVDLRDSALCDSHCRQFEVEQDPCNKSFFSEIISSISCVRYSADGRYILARDYLDLKLWDVNMESKPVLTVPVHPYIQPHLADLYETDCIFDKYQCAISNDGIHLLTGCYDNNFLIHNLRSQSSLTIEALKEPPKRMIRAPGAAPSPQPTPNVHSMDFGKKALHVSIHPTQDVLAVAGLNKLYIYEGFR